jgi:hypothetical protein
MLARVSAFLLSRISAERLKPFGFRLLIGSLSGDVLVLIFVPPGLEEKILSAICTVGIIAGIWLEEIAERQLHGAELEHISAGLASGQTCTRSSGARRVRCQITVIQMQ